MNDERLTREQQRRMLELFEQAALHDYPNPERIGCPGSEFLKRLATDRKSIDLNDPALTHVARCSPCFREFAGYRDKVKRKTLTRRVAIGTGGALVVGLVVTVVRLATVPPTEPEAYERVTLDLFNASAVRGQETDTQSTAPKTSLPRKRLDLVITLPFASPEGNYEVQVLDASGKPTGLSAAGTAHLLNDRTILEARIDVSSLPPNPYQIGIRRVPFDWMPVPVQIR
jgi:hypothetical protein